MDCRKMRKLAKKSKNCVFRLKMVHFRLILANSQKSENKTWGGLSRLTVTGFVHESLTNWRRVRLFYHGRKLSRTGIERAPYSHQESRHNQE